MGDLSWNPTSWTPSNLAEEAVEFMTGSEVAGDVAGLATAWITGDAMGIASQAGDLGQNVMAGAGKLTWRVDWPIPLPIPLARKRNRHLGRQRRGCSTMMIRTPSSLPSRS